MNITVRVETHYGRTLVYPVCDQAHLFALIAGTKTLTSLVLQSIKDLGFTIEVAKPELPKEAI